METLKIDILNPKVKALLENLSDMKLIRINSEQNIDFAEILESIRSGSNEEISMEEITKEVEAVRKARYEK